MSEEIKKETEKTADETVKETAVNAAATEKKDDDKSQKENKLEILVAIFLGITALLTAWATWIGSLHGGNQATNYTKSNNLAAEGNSEYNSGLQDYLSDLMAWNEIVGFNFDIEIANLNGKTEEAELIATKLDIYTKQNCNDILKEGLEWFDTTDDAESPFEKPGLVDQYFENANALLSESQDLLEEGQKDNANGDSYNLVNVIYSVVLFMLGIIGIFKRLPNRTVVFGIAVFFLVLATIYMITIPMPTNFSFSSFFSH